MLLTRQARHLLKKRCTTPIEAFRRFGDTIDTPDGPLTYIDRDGDVLAIAHLDYVLWAEPQLHHGNIYCPQLDDRLGVWAILDVLPALGVNVDVLLTDSEENGASTGGYFAPPKDYNWMFQLDRAGTDVVLYQYDTPELRRRLSDWDVQYGVFSDISMMEHVGCAGINFGIGYHYQHTRKCFANIGDAVGQVCRVATFWRQFSDIEMPYYKPDIYEKASTDEEHHQTAYTYDDLWWECPCGIVNYHSDDECDCGLPQWKAAAFGYY